jgi:hypothetical protein
MLVRDSLFTAVDPFLKLIVKTGCPIALGCILISVSSRLATVGGQKYSYWTANAD